MGLYTDTSKLKWIFWTSHHSVLLIDMLLKSSRNLSTRTNGSLGLQIHNNQSMTKTSLTNSLPKTSPSHRKRRVTEDKEGHRKWCDFHKIPWHNTDECRSKQSLVAEIKDKEPNPDSESDYENTGKGQIIDADPTAIVATTTIQPEEPTDPEEGEHLFHSQMWVKGTLLHFIVDSGSQKNLISAEVIKQLGLSTTPHPQPYNIGWLHQGRDLHVSQQCRLSYGIQPFKDEVLCDVSPLDVCDVLLGQPYMWKRHVVYESRPRSVIVSLGGSSLQNTRGSSDYCST
jgi:hypothetical protein